MCLYPPSSEPWSFVFSDADLFVGFVVVDFGGLGFFFLGFLGFFPLKIPRNVL